MFLYTGTWRTLLVSNARHFMKIDDGVPLQTAATIFINPLTAYRMLKSFVNLVPGRSLYVHFFRDFFAHSHFNFKVTASYRMVPTVESVRV